MDSDILKMSQELKSIVVAAGKIVNGVVQTATLGVYNADKNQEKRRHQELKEREQQLQERVVELETRQAETRARATC